MKYIWEKEDIVAGLVVCKHPSYQGNEEFTPCGNTLKWVYQIGFLTSRERKTEESYVTIALVDGMVFPQETKQEIVDQFNRDEMMPMPYKWLAKILEYKMKGHYTA